MHRSPQPIMPILIAPDPAAYTPGGIDMAPRVAAPVAVADAAKKFRRLVPASVADCRMTNAPFSMRPRVPVLVSTFFGDPIAEGNVPVFRVARGKDLEAAG